MSMEIKDKEQNIKGAADAKLLRVECNALRGLAIMGIMLHNFCHWLSPIVKENEYQFIQQHIDWFDDVMSAPIGETPLEFFHIVSFFGHYGVPVFLFLSGYGLYLKYELPLKGQAEAIVPSAFRFVRYHWLKLFRMMIVGFVAFVLIDNITAGAHKYDVMAIFGQMGLFNNLMEHPDKVIWPGPYWYFGLMFQCYIVYRLLLFRKHWSYAVAMIVVCTLIQALCEPEGETLNRVRYNFIGGMLPFCLGLLSARYLNFKNWQPYLSVFIASCVCVYLGSFYFYTWLFVPMFICAAAISFVVFISRTQKHFIPHRWIMKALNWIGTISAAMFVSHPIVRKILIPISREGNYWTGLLLYVICAIGVAWLFNELIKRVPSPKLK